MKVGNGRGYCVGVPGNPYTSDVSQSTSGLVPFFLISYDALFILFQSGGKPNKQICRKTCAAFGGPGFRGYTFFDNNSDQLPDCACQYDDGHAPDCPSADDLIGFPVKRDFDCAKSEAGTASGPIEGVVDPDTDSVVALFGPDGLECFKAVDSYGDKSGKAKGEYYPSSRSGLDV